MCRVDWDILHRYVDSMIWPVFVFSLFILFRKQLIKLVNRIADDSEQIEIAGLFKAQFKQVERLREDLRQGNVDDKRVEKVISATINTQIEAIRLCGQNYIHSNFDQRRIIESQISDYSIGLEPIDILTLVDSDNIGVKIAAAISLGHVLYHSKIDTINNKEIKQFIIQSLDDDNSFLRYQALHLILLSDELSFELRGKLETMKLNDRNQAIRTLLKLHFK